MAELHNMLYSINEIEQEENHRDQRHKSIIYTEHLFYLINSIFYFFLQSDKKV